MGHTLEKGRFFIELNEFLFSEDVLPKLREFQRQDPLSHHWNRIICAYFWTIRTIVNSITETCRQARSPNLASYPNCSVRQFPTRFRVGESKNSSVQMYFQEFKSVPP